MRQVLNGFGIGLMVTSIVDHLGPARDLTQHPAWHLVPATALLMWLVFDAWKGRAA